MEDIERSREYLRGMKLKKTAFYEMSDRVPRWNFVRLKKGRWGLRRVRRRLEDPSYLNLYIKLDLFRVSPILDGGLSL